MSELSMLLTHWGRVTHICVSNLTIIGSDNGLSPGRRQAIIWTNAGILLNGPLGTNFNEMFIKIHTFSFKKIHLKMASAKWRPFCLGLNVLNVISNDMEPFSCPSCHITWEKSGWRAFLRWWPPSAMWEGPFNFLWSQATGDVWIIPSFQIWGYVLHVVHISCVITNCGQH